MTRIYHPMNSLISEDSVSFGSHAVMGKTENPFQGKPNLLKEKCVRPFNNLFVYYSTDRMMEQTISSQGTFLRHLSADN